jgi:hypothetical protein
MRSLLPLFSVLAVAVSLQAAPTSAPTAKPTTTAPVAQSAEKAPENFPLTLRGFFGKDAAAEISVQDKASGKSVWLSPGGSHTGWKLESAAPAKGRAVFSQGKRRVTLFLTGESHEPVTARLESVYDSVMFRKFCDLMKNPEYDKFIDAVEAEARASLLKSNPELFSAPEEEDRAAKLALPSAIEQRRILLSKNSPEAEAVKAVMLPLLDATIQEKSAPAAAGGENEVVDEEHAHVDPSEIRIYENAHKLYIQRNGGK